MDKLPFVDLANQLTDSLTEYLKRTAVLRLKEEELRVKERDFTARTENFELEKECWQKRKEAELRRIEAKNTAFAVLKAIPPPMSHKGKKEHFPIVRFSYKKNHTWYQTFITQYTDLCRVLRFIHGLEGTSEAVQIQISAVFNLKNFPAKNYEDLRLRVAKLVVLLEDIDKQCSHAQISQSISFFKHLSYPVSQTETEEESQAEETEEESEEYITVSLDENPEFHHNVELIREEEEESYDQQAEEEEEET